MDAWSRSISTNTFTVAIFVPSFPIFYGGGYLYKRKGDGSRQVVNGHLSLKGGNWTK